MQQLLYEDDHEFILNFMKQEDVEIKAIELFLERFLYSYKRNKAKKVLENVEIKD